MRVDRVILRAFLSSLAAVTLLLAFMLGVLCLAFPSTMMDMTYRLGMEGASIHFAERVYENSGEVSYIAFATEVAIEEEDAEKILSCGKRLLADEGYADYCKEQNVGYGRYVCGRVCIAEYQSGEKAAALERAFGSLEKGKFPQSNPVVALVVAAEGDEPFLSEIGKKLSSLAIDNDADAGYRNQVLRIITEEK